MQVEMNRPDCRRFFGRPNAWLATLWFVCVLLSVSAGSVFAQADAGQTQIPLSDQLQAIIDAEGADAAGNWFDANWPVIKDQYSVDAQAMMALMSGYLTAGDHVAAQTVGQVTATVMQDTMAEAMQTHSPEMMDELNAQREAGAREQAAVDFSEGNNQTTKGINNRGEKREDLGRFSGLYGAPDGRQLFVTQSCDGYLVAGAMWGDVSPWWMHSVADSEFDYSDSFISLGITFTVNNNGQADQLTHNLEGLSSPLSRIGDLPSEFPACTERPYR